MGLGVGVVVLGQSVAALRLGTEPGIWGIGVGGTLLIASSVLLSPFLSGATAAPVARAVRALAPQDRRVDAEFAAENIKRSPRRSGAAISALFITTWLLTGAAAGASSARETLLANLDAGHSHDINVYQAFDSEGLGMGISPEQQASVAAARGVDLSGVSIGAMIELPRAAMTAEDLAEEADFFSFGTNDLTQTVWGFSRDDVEGVFFPQYIEAGIFGVSPFESIDVHGVGTLVSEGVRRARSTKPNIKLGVCGEHGGDPASIHFFHGVGLDYVSCSPFRVPVARLEAGRAAVEDHVDMTA